MNEEEIEKLFTFEKLQIPESDFDFIDFDELQLRNQRINKINDDASMLKEIFQDLYEIVYGQQASIDEIENNVSETKENVENAETELIKAEEFQKKAYRNQTLLSTIMIAGISTPVGLSLGLKVGLETAGGLGLIYLMTKLNNF